MDDKELELCTNLLGKVKEALGHAVERVWPSFYADLLNGGWENALTIKLGVEKHNSSSGCAKVQSVGWLPKPKVVDKDFPEFDVDGSQLTIEFDKPTRPAPSASADGATCSVPAASAVGEYPPDIMEKLHLWMEAAKELNCPLYIPCLHKGVPGKEKRYDRWEGGICSSCAPVPDGDEWKKTLFAMASDGIVCTKDDGQLMLCHDSMLKISSYGYEVIEVKYNESGSIQEWRPWPSSVWNESREGFTPFSNTNFIPVNLYLE